MEKYINENYSREIKIINAKWPRLEIDSTLNKFDKLKIVYEVFDFKYKSQIKLSHQINFNLVFCHGSGMSRSIWDYYIYKLTELIEAKPNSSQREFHINKIISIDQVNHGESYQLNKYKLGPNYNWNDGARDIIKIMELELYKNSTDSNTLNILIGHSMGGFQSLSANAHLPNNTLIDLTFIIEPVLITHTFIPDSNITIVSSNFVKAISKKIKSNFSSIDEFNDFLNYSSFYNKNTNQDILNSIKKYELKVTLDQKTDGGRVEDKSPTLQVTTKMNFYQNLLCYLTNKPASPWLLNNLQFINNPIISIFGEKSDWCPVENQIALSKNLKNYKEYFIPDGNHLINLEKPDKIIEIILENLTLHVEHLNHNEFNKRSKILTVEERQKLFLDSFDQFVKLRIRERGSKL
ncbi:hypothetical protein TBLA_0I01640 [Henningerozyma blattae CBS 6284]|uniref:AB hydrolase-1 domain-containing protein n=1 Tax=Henningerozyma blattae (strain ATCC 34711 / CBS 6284 / DSM 70876 / NBRC 10599 / NRRL Y-10934 / UCD 77-7) TaxID=1071380 RepID=I2H8X0_HENB6|nr:hypothetical protein TBLA_0I01640 [Tetrapisispora blattae CBS 6284]CCH62822.1 hypothetical protein TBLA_0I01640 [Tetrapisispora blattae CBS 6284]